MPFFLSFFLCFFAQLHLARFSRKLTVAREHTLLRPAVSPRSRKSCSFEVVKETGRKGRSTVDVPWVLRIRHIELLRVPVQLGLPRSHCSDHIHVFFPTLIPFLSLLKSVLLKSVLVQAVLLHECSMVLLFMLSILVQKSKRNKMANSEINFRFYVYDAISFLLLLYLRFL